MTINSLSIERYVCTLLGSENHATFSSQCISQLHKAVISKTCEIDHRDRTVMKAVKNGLIHPSVRIGSSPYLNRFVTEFLDYRVNDVPKKALDSFVLRHCIIQQANIEC